MSYSNSDQVHCYHSSIPIWKLPMVQNHSEPFGTGLKAEPNPWNQYILVWSSLVTSVVWFWTKPWQHYFGETRHCSHSRSAITLHFTALSTWNLMTARKGRSRLQKAASLAALACTKPSNKENILPALLLLLLSLLYCMWLFWLRKLDLHCIRTAHIIRHIA